MDRESQSLGGRQGHCGGEWRIPVVAYADPARKAASSCSAYGLPRNLETGPQHMLGASPRP